MTTPIVRAGQGTLLKLASATIAQRVSIEGPEMEVAAIPTTHLDTTGGKTYRPAQLYDGGTVSCTAYYDPQDTTHLAVFALMVPTPTAGAFSLVLTDGSIYAFSAILTKWAPTGMEEESNLEVEIELKVSGNVTVTAPS